MKTKRSGALQIKKSLGPKYSGVRRKEKITFYLLNISLASSLAFQFKWLGKYSYTSVVAGVAYVSEGSTVIIDSLPKRS